MRYATIIFLALFLPLTAFAGQVEDARAALKSLDFKKALKLYQPLAEKGDIEAQNKIGMIYQSGLGIKQDLAESLKWYRMAADQGDINGLFMVGWAYDGGFGVAQDRAEAAKWYLKAANAGDWASQQALMQAYLSGGGVQKDYAEAYYWSLVSRKTDPETTEAFFEKSFFADPAKHLTPEQKVAIEKRAEEWKPASFKTQGKL
jgi:TPR repeat protein